MKLVTLTRVDDDQRRGEHNSPRSIAINPAYVVAVRVWSDTTTEVTLDIRSTTERVFVSGKHHQIVTALNG